jgi:hypothetical protein
MQGNNMKVKISVGDFIDRYSILLIKEELDLDVYEELLDYKETAQEFSPKFFNYYLDIFKKVNKILWDIETDKRKNSSRYTNEYSDLSTLTLQYNDLRHYLKKLVDEFYASEISEQKNHEKNINNR